MASRSASNDSCLNGNAFHSVTVAIEIPIWLTADDITTAELDTVLTL